MKYEVWCYDKIVNDLYKMKAFSSLAKAKVYKTKVEGNADKTFAFKIKRV